MYVFMYGHLSAGQLSIFLDSVSMASSSGEVAVFADTNMGTHIAMAVSPDITAADFNSKLILINNLALFSLLLSMESCVFGF